MMHLNAIGLASIGFKLVASYRCITKGEKALNIECYTDGKQYIVRSFRTGEHAWDNAYDSAKQANAKVKQLWSMYSFHKRIV